jgi:hypothetical protein
MSSTSKDNRLTLLTQAVGVLELLFGKKHLAVWRIERGRVAPLYGLVQTDQRPRATVPGLCKRHADDLAAGCIVHDAGSTLLPLVGDGGLLGVIHVAGEPENLPALLLPIARAVVDALTRVLAMPAAEPHELAALAQRLPALTATTSDAEQIEAEMDAAHRQVSATERRRLVYRLQCNEWNVSQTARELGWGRTRLWLRMREFGIRRPTPAPTDPRRAHRRQPSRRRDAPTRLSLAFAGSTWRVVPPRVQRGSVDVRSLDEPTCHVRDAKEQSMERQRGARLGPARLGCATVDVRPGGSSSEKRRLVVPGGSWSGPSGSKVVAESMLRSRWRRLSC